MPGHRFRDFLQSGIPEISVIFQGNKHVERSIVSNITNLVVDKHFICFTATCNVFTIYCKTNKVLFICVTSKGANLYENTRMALRSFQDFYIRFETNIKKIKKLIIIKLIRIETE